MGGLSLISVLYVTLSYVAAGLFFGGLAYKIGLYSLIPSPLKIPTTPQPVTPAGVVWRNIVNISTFSDLFKGNRWTWAGGYALHIVLVFVLLRHLRFFMEPVPSVLSKIQYLIWYLSALLPLPIIYLWVRRKAVDRVAYITTFADVFILGLLFFIGLTGVSLKILARTDVVAVKKFLMGIILFSPENIPTHPVFLIHFTLVLILAVYFPFSKLLHAGGMFFSPTTAQADNPREVRHINPWASE